MTVTLAVETDVTVTVVVSTGLDVRPLRVLDAVRLRVEGAVVAVITEAAEEVGGEGNDDAEEELELTAEVRVVNVERLEAEVELLRRLLLLELVLATLDTREL